MSPHEHVGITQTWYILGDFRVDYLFNESIHRCCFFPLPRSNENIIWCISS